MPTEYEDTPRLANIERLELALGGAPMPEIDLVPGEHDKQARKQRKRNAKRRRDAERPPDSFERWRILSELVNEGRQVVDLADHKARYALVVMGVLNAGVYFLMSRSHLFASLAPGVKPWLIGFMIAYAALTFLFVYHAVDCLRPRRLQYADLVSSNRGGEAHAPQGILFWETIATYGLEAYQRAWSTARMEQLNAEVVIIAHYQARLIRAKYVALGRLYLGLAVLVVLAGCLLAAFTMLGLAA
jgi:hypothetical protein